MARPGATHRAAAPSCTPGDPGLLDDSGAGPRARRHPGVPARLPFTLCAVTLDRLHRQGDGPRAAGTTDGTPAHHGIQEDPVGGSSGRARSGEFLDRQACCAAVRIDSRD
jgi:hypothetical protein